MAGRQTAPRRHDPAAGMGDDSAASKLDKKVMGSIKRFHLNKNPTNLGKCMCVGTGAPRNPQGAPQLLGSTVELGLRPAVEDLNDVDLSRDPLDRVFAEVAPAAVVRVFQVDETSLPFDRRNGLFWRQPGENRLLEEEADELPFIGQNLLSDDGGFAGPEERPSAVDAFMISKEDGGEAQLAAAASDLERRNPAIKRSGAVQVQIHPDPGGNCASGHVRYYRRGKGSGKGSRKVRTSEGWRLAGKERLSLRNKSARWN